MQNVPEVRLITASDGETPVFYAVVKGPHGWYGAPGLRKGQFLTDADVADAIPLVPQASVHAVVGKKSNGMFDVDVNGKPGARNVSEFIAGAFITQAALQKGEPIMVTASEVDTPVARKVTGERRLGVVKNGG